ncbi:nucleotide exchange factor GrpE [Polaromonas sp.]|nr:nucleotide exchange factor GrpE [Candidatus Saccharibacteria bacterium]
MTKKDVPQENDDDQATPIEPIEVTVAGPDDAATPFEDQLLQLTDALQRERADALNLRRRHEAEMNNLRTRVKSSIIHDLLPVIDNFERALKHVPADLEGNDYIKGVQGVVKQFETTLGDMGVERIKSVGEAFDPHFHEAISMDEGEGTEEIVSEELQAGFKIGDDVIRHAMVRVKQQ